MIVVGIRPIGPDYHQEIAQASRAVLRSANIALDVFADLNSCCPFPREMAMSGIRSPNSHRIITKLELRTTLHVHCKGGDCQGSSTICARDESPVVAVRRFFQVVRGTRLWVKTPLAGTVIGSTLYTVGGYNLIR